MSVAIGAALALSGVCLIIKSEGLEAKPGISLTLFGSFLTIGGIFVMVVMF